MDTENAVEPVKLDHDYAYWHTRLAGLGAALPRIDEPQPGFYRHTSGDPVTWYRQPWTGEGPPPADRPVVCVRYTRGQPREQSELQSLELWPWCCANAETDEDWRKAAAGEEWPNEAPGFGHNRPPPGFQTPTTRAAKAIDAAEQWIASNPEIKTKAQADQAAHLATELRHSRGDLTDEEKHRKKPFQAFIAQIGELYKGQIAKVQDAENAVKRHLQPYLTAIDDQQKKEREEAKAAAAEARGNHQRAPSTGVPTTRVGGRGHAIVMKDFKSAKIVDYRKTLRAVSDHPDVVAVVQKLADAAARAKDGELLPGTELVVERRAV